ncbi:MAG: hypothetical protein KAS32_02700, partial [Candidatus Peribacteraceae bacterium]|nr:hypothetical protein [Candidatus Peribacteraceae bacterium]
RIDACKKEAIELANETKADVVFIHNEIIYYYEYKLHNNLEIPEKFLIKIEGDKIQFVRTLLTTVVQTKEII